MGSPGLPLIAPVCLMKLQKLTKHNLCRNMAATDEVVVYGKKMEKPNESIPVLQRSVKAQVHSLESKGRHHRIISTENSRHVFDDKEEIVVRGINSIPTGRSRSVNPPLPKTIGDRKHCSKNGKPIFGPQMSMAFQAQNGLEDDFASRVNISSKDITATVGKKQNTSDPPPMPEKIKIHLKSNERIPTSAKKTSKGKKKIEKSHTSKSKQRRPDQPLPELPSLNESSSQSINHPYEVVPSDVVHHQVSSLTETTREQYKRSRSLGPVVEAAQKELLASAVAFLESTPQSKIPPIPTNNEELTNALSSSSKAKPSKNNFYYQNNFDKENDKLSTGFSGYNKQMGAYRAKEGCSLESSRGRSRIKSNVERSVSTTGASNKKTIKIDKNDTCSTRNQATPDTNIGGRGSFLLQSRMPARQKSMIDLRDASWPDQALPPHLHYHHQLQVHSLFSLQSSRNGKEVG